MDRKHGTREYIEASAMGTFEHLLSLASSLY